MTKWIFVRDEGMSILTDEKKVSHDFQDVLEKILGQKFQVNSEKTS